MIATKPKEMVLPKVEGWKVLSNTNFIRSANALMKNDWKVPTNYNNFVSAVNLLCIEQPNIKIAGDAICTGSGRSRLPLGANWQKQFDGLKKAYLKNCNDKFCSEMPCGDSRTGFECSTSMKAKKERGY